MLRQYRWVVLVLVSLTFFGVSALAQRGVYFREGGFPTRLAPPQMPDGRFVICRLAYTRVRQERSGIGWETDYPYAEINLTTRLSELTKTRVSRDDDGIPNHYVVRATDQALFNCPVIFASDAGVIGFREEEVEQLRQYFLKGGFLWADDFWGSLAWDHWASEIQRVLPPPDYVIEDVEPSDPLLRALFEVDHIPQITNILFWRDNGEYTSERGADSEQVHFRAIRDRSRRIMVLMSHNTDIADSWEREGEDPAFFLQFSPRGYALGINTLLHVMTH